MRQELPKPLVYILLILPFALQAQFTAITNEGQWPEHVAASAQLNGGNVYFSEMAVHYNFLDTTILIGRNSHLHDTGEQFAMDVQVDDRLRGHHYQMEFAGANPSAMVRFEKPLEGRINYFLGKDRAKWGRGASRYGEVVYNEIYEGIDCAFFQSKDGHLKYEFTLEPGADPAQIRLTYHHINSLRLTNKGRLSIGTSVNTVTEYIPLVYQPNGNRKDTISCQYQLDHNTVTFHFPQGFDSSRPLIIDPVLNFSSYSGSTADNFGFTATYDTAGHLYGGGIAFGQGYPFTNGAYDTIFNGGNEDISITKFSKDGSQLVYSTYIGGSSDETPNSLYVGPQGNLYMYGFTGSVDFPVTNNAYDTTFNGGDSLTIAGSGTSFHKGTDIYVLKLSKNGDSLLASTYIGGSGNDGPNTAVKMVFGYPDTSLRLNYGDPFRGEVFVDDSGDAYIASCTQSNDFPFTPDAFDQNFNGSQDGVVFQLSKNLDQLKWSTYLGGADIDAAFSLKLDGQGRLVISGGTTSEDFPSYPKGHFPNYRGGVSDGYIIIFENSTKQLSAATFVGGNGLDNSYFVEIDFDGNIYVTGNTDSDNFPIVGNNAALSNSGQFITKFDDTLGNILMSTRFGSGSGLPELSPTAFLVDVCKNIYVSGWGGQTNGPAFQPLITHPQPNMTNMPLTDDAFQHTTDGSDFYFIVFSEDADSLIYGTYFGGNISKEHVDGGTSRFDKDGIIYQAVCAGCLGNDDFPTTAGAWSNTNNSFNCNLGVAKFEFQLLEVKSHAIAGPDTFDCAPLEVQFENLGTDNAYYYWDFDNGDFSERENPMYTFEEPGSYDISLVVKPRKPCLIADTTQVHVEVLPRAEADFDYAPKQIELNDKLVFTNLSVGADTYTWYLDGNPVSNTEHWETTLPEVGLYKVCLEIENEECIDSICQNIIIPIIDVPNAFSPNGDGNNDVLYVRGYGVLEVEFRLYNRWGQLMFQTTDLNKGWDGTFKGKPQEMDVYVYVLNATLEDGRVVDRKGNITLIR